MRILFVDFTLPYLLKDSNYPVGGWAVELQTWIGGLKQAGAETGVLTWKGAAAYAGNEHGVELLDTYDPNQGIKILKYFYLYIPAMLRAAKKFRPDVIIQACSGLDTGIMAYIARKIGVPFVYRAASDRDADARFALGLPKYAQLAYKWGLAHAAAILPQNEYQLGCFQKTYPSSKLCIHHNPFDISRPIPTLIPRTRKNYIAWLGVFKKPKNLPLLCSVAKSLPDIEFKVAGMPYATMDQETQTALDDLKTINNVKFTGYVKQRDVLDFLSHAIALLSTSHYEGFSNTFLEALFAGTPVIAPLRVDPDQIITRNKLGLTAALDEDLPSHILQVAQMNPKNYAALSRRCRTYVLTNHDPAAKAFALLNILRPLAGRR